MLRLYLGGILLFAIESMLLFRQAKQKRKPLCKEKRQHKHEKKRKRSTNGWENEERMSEKTIFGVDEREIDTSCVSSLLIIAFCF